VLYSFSQRLSTDALFDSTFTTLIFYTDSLLNNYDDSLNIIDSLALADTTIDYSIQRGLIVDQISIHRNTRLNLTTTKQQLVEGIRDSVRIINMHSTPADLPEINERAVNEYYLLYNRFGKDTLAFYYSQLLAIATQCPTAGGPSVYRARNFVRMFNDSIQYNDPLACIQAGFYRTPNSTNDLINYSQLSEISLIPNPANDYVEVKIKNLVGGKTSIQITGTGGEEIINKTLKANENTTHISTQNILPGVYYVRILNGRKVYPVEKLVIIKK
jgi:hypothetical protein